MISLSCSCVAPNQYGTQLWTVTSFALADSSESANQVWMHIKVN